MANSRNKDSAETRKVSENTAPDTQSVKSGKKRGPKSTYTEERAAAILERIALGEPLRQICRDEGQPAWRTVYDWMMEEKDFATRFARARELGEDAIAQECLDIADNAANDWMEQFDAKSESTGWKLNGEHVQRSKLRIETRLKLLAKWNPKKWGEKVAIGGADDLPPVRSMTENDLDRQIADLQAKLKNEYPDAC